MNATIATIITAELIGVRTGLNDHIMGSESNSNVKVIGESVRNGSTVTVLESSFHEATSVQPFL